MSGKAKAPKQRNLRRRNAITGYLFILPFIIGFLAFLLRPLIQSFQMSLSTVTLAMNSGAGSKGYTLKLIKTWKNTNYYYAFFSDVNYKNYLVDSLKNMAIQVPAILVFSFFIALILNQEFKGRGFIRAIFFLPVILSSGVIVGLEYNNTLTAGMQDLIAESGGGFSITQSLEDLLRTTGVGGKILDPVFKIIDSVYDVALASGIQIIIFISGLQTVSPSMYEAAKIEGCTAWESFWKITFPLVSSMILVNLVYSVVDFLMRTDNQVMSLINDTANKFQKYGQAAAMSWSYFGIVAAVLGILALILSKKVYYYE